MLLTSYLQVTLLGGQTTALDHLPEEVSLDHVPFFLTALLTITRIMNKINNREEMKYMCKVIRSDEVKRAQAPPIILKKNKIQIIIKTRLNLTDTKS